MSHAILADNLTYASSLYPSIAEVCRRIGINRQQFNKYLAGQVRPSSYNMRRICDFFGVTEAELMMDSVRFADLVSLRRRARPNTKLPPYLRQIEQLQQGSGSLERYLGYYYRYNYAFSYPGKITCSLAVIFSEGERCFWKNIEVIKNTKLNQTRSASKYEGMIFLLGERIHILEYEPRVATTITQLMLYPNYQARMDYLIGLQTGGPMKRGRKPAAATVLLEYLGRNIDLRRALERCGMFDEDEINPEIQGLIYNQIPPGDYVFEVEQL